MPYVRRNGVRVHFEVAGRGFPVVMLPGATGDASSWRTAGYVPRLEDAFCCVAVDPRGMGSSARPADASGYGIGEIAADVLAIADDLGRDRLAVWGHSLGGAVGTVLAADAPERLAGLVLSGSHPVFDYSLARQTWTRLAQWAREAGDPAVVVRQLCDDEGIAPAHWVRTADHGNAEVVARLLEGTLDYDWEGRATPAQIRLPTLIVVGELEDPEDAAGAVADAMPDARRVRLPGLGHVGAFVDAEASLAHTRPFLTAVAAGVAVPRSRD